MTPPWARARPSDRNRHPTDPSAAIINCAVRGHVRIRNLLLLLRSDIQAMLIYTFRHPILAFFLRNLSIHVYLISLYPYSALMPLALVASSSVSWS